MYARSVWVPTEDRGNQQGWGACCRVLYYGLSQRSSGTSRTRCRPLALTVLRGSVYMYARFVWVPTEDRGNQQGWGARCRVLYGDLLQRLAGTSRVGVRVAGFSMVTCHRG